MTPFDDVPGLLLRALTGDDDARWEVVVAPRRAVTLSRDVRDWAVFGSTTPTPTRRPRRGRGRYA
jgi:hypothetical protein